MAQISTFQKILTVREREKIAAQKAYQLAVSHFEEVATQLYQLLRKKEYAEQEYEALLSATSPVTIITNQYAYIERLAQQIRSIETAVSRARSNMESQQSDLTNAYIETKKFEKIIEMKQTQQMELEMNLEKKHLDEISVTQFLKSKDG